MAGKKSKSSGKVSNGGRQKANLAHEAKRQTKFAKKRENGNAYVYKKNPYNPETQRSQYIEEEHNRAEKSKSSKLPYARLESIFAKLQNELDNIKLANKNK